MRTRMALGVCVLALLSCGPPSRESARDLTVTRACNRYQACGEIAAGKTYATLDECDVKQTAYWEGVWPAADCDGKINSTALDTCWKTIDIADCTNFFDLAQVVAKCAKGNVCTGAAGKLDGG